MHRSALYILVWTTRVCVLWPRSMCLQPGWIKCQVDRMPLPCGCSWDGCGNVAGRMVRGLAHGLQSNPDPDSLPPHHHEAGAGVQAAGEPPASPRRGALSHHQLQPGSSTGCGNTGLPGVHRGERDGGDAPAGRRGTGTARGGGGLQRPRCQPGLGHREPGVCSPRVCIYADTHILHLHYLYTFVSMMYFTINTTLK